MWQLDRAKDLVLSDFIDQQRALLRAGTVISKHRVREDTVHLLLWLFLFCLGKTQKVPATSLSDAESNVVASPASDIQATPSPTHVQHEPTPKIKSNYRDTFPVLVYKKQS